MASLLLRRALCSLSNSLTFVGKNTGPYFSMSMCFRACTKNIMDLRNTFLLPSNDSLIMQQVSGLKTKGVLKKRCKDCYIVKRRGRFYVYCKSNGKHKQRLA
ncbi:hypothetical protein GDO81_028671 [Engystomops pustulosus]|uniref:Ribosomal protein n=1 Tax=Engystomops pustulosus TaxID=76066 RepID=A0AAV6ZS42_ENGPU|nr:hypothetical protein GDO81_028671 [Engystomops pustulosus]